MKLIIKLILCLGIFCNISNANRRESWQGLYTLNEDLCIGKEPGFGPFDYRKRNMNPKDLSIVERGHFPPYVENLVRGRTSTTPFSDLDYTLRAWPNHARALLSIIRYQIKKNKKLIKDKIPTPPECYLQRAINFSPKDPVPYYLFGYYLGKVDRPKQAVEKYEKALNLSPENAKFEYAYSLLLIELKQYEKALRYAKQAYQHGKPPPGLKNKLKKLGIWK